MKVFKYVFGLIIVSGMLASCTDDDNLVLNELSEEGALTLSSSGGDEFNLQIEKADEEATTFSWDSLDLNVNTPVRYFLEMAETGTDFADPVTLMRSNKTSFSMTVSELNARALSFGVEPDSVGSIDTRVIGRVGSGNSKDYVSNVFTATVIPYADVVDISTAWGIVGDATPNGWDGPDIPFYKTEKEETYIAYGTLTDGEIKFRQNNSWDDEDYGGSGGVLEEGGDNIEVESGRYKITMNLDELTYKLEKYSIGVVGGAAPNGWDGPDAPMDFDPETQTFRARVSLTGGEIKFRVNNE